MENLTQNLYKGKVTVRRDGRHQYFYSFEGKGGVEHKAKGVTSILGVLDKPALRFWAAGKTAECLLMSNGLGTLAEAKSKIENDAEFALQKVTATVAEVISAASEHTRYATETADIGKKIHAFAESYIKGENPTIPIEEDERVINGINAFLDLVKQNDMQFVASERIVFSMKLRYVGQADYIAKIKGKYYLGDFKTGSPQTDKRTGERSPYYEQMLQTQAYADALQEENAYKFAGRIITYLDKNTGEVSNFFLPMSKSQSAKFKALCKFVALDE